MLKKNWYSENSVATTVHNVIEAVDPLYLKQASERDFQQGLLDEIKFIGILPEDFQQKTESYIRKHIHELYLFAKKVAAKESFEEASAE